MTIFNKFLLNTLQFLFYIFPVSFVFGNSVTNLFILSISLIGIYYYNIELFKWKEKYLVIFLSLFFGIILFSTYLQSFLVSKNPDTIKSIYFLRYLFLLFILRTMIVKRDLKVNYMIIGCLIITLLLSTDVIIQYLFGKNLLGYEPISWVKDVTYHTSIFKNDLKAGGFILMFCLLGIFGVPIIFKNKKKSIMIIFSLLVVIFFMTALILTANRMPFIMFMFFIMLVPLIHGNKKNRLISIFLAMVFIASFVAFALTSENLKKRYKNFIIGIPNPVVIISEIQKDYPELEKYKNSGIRNYHLEEYKKNDGYNTLPFFTGHLQIYITSIDLFLDKPLIGRGIKSYRNYCSEKMHLPNRICQSHPHNFVLEILNDVGLIGFLFIFLPLIKLLFSNYKDYKQSYNKPSDISHWVYLAVLLSIFIQFFPLRSSGSFFSTFNAAYTFYLLGISVGLSEIRKKPKI